MVTVAPTGPEWGVKLLIFGVTVVVIRPSEHLLAVIQGRARGSRASSARLAPGTGVLDSRCVSQGVDPAGHVPTENVGCQKLSGQKKIEVKYWTQLWTAAKLNAAFGKCGDAVLKKTPIRM